MQIKPCCSCDQYTDLDGEGYCADCGVRMDCGEVWCGDCEACYQRLADQVLDWEIEAGRAQAWGQKVRT